MRSAVFAAQRAVACDDLIGRLASLAGRDPALDIGSHPVTAALVLEGSPLGQKAYKHREDLIDALLCAWTASLWLRWGVRSSQVLGASDPARDVHGLRATIIAPARPEQRRN